MGKLDGKVALITGAGRRLGQGAAEGALFTEEGATVVLTDVLDEEGEQTAASFGGRYMHHDVTDETQWREVIDATVKTYGRVDILINNAGMWRQAGVLESTLAEYRQVIDVNQVGVFLGMQAAGRQMVQQRSGSIVNISSTAGLIGWAGTIAYIASKWAVRGMTKSAAQSLGQYGIRVNSIHPGLIETPMLHEVPAVDSGQISPLIARFPLGRIAEPIEVARMALFLASDDSSYSTGAEFVVDGGWTSG